MEANNFYELAKKGFDFTNGSINLRERRFRSLFGVSAEVTAILWNILHPTLDQYARPVQLLWTLYFLKQYSPEHNNAYLWGCTEKTFRKWCWYFINKISKLKLVRYLLQNGFILLL